MPKVLIITESLNNGGAERQLALLVKYLPPGWEKRVWSMADGPYKSVIENCNVHVDISKRSWRYDITPAFKLWRIIKEWSPDIIHSWTWMGSFGAAPMCRVYKIPLIDGTIRMGIKPPGNWWRLRLGWMLADGVIANSRAGLNDMHISERKGKVVYNGFDPRRLELIDASKKKNEKFTVVMVGRMEKAKDFRNYINVARCITEKDKKWSFLAIGNGTDRKSLIENSSDLIEAGIMMFPEVALEVLPLIKSADVGVLINPSEIHAEGCSNAIMEYMACKLPVICTKGGGNQEIVMDGQTGFMILPGNVDDLVEKLQFLKDNQEIAQKMGEEGHKLFLELFSVQRMVEQTLGIYSNFMKTI